MVKYRDWKSLQQSFLSHYINYPGPDLNYYDLVYISLDEQGRPTKVRDAITGEDFFCVFTALEKSIFLEKKTKIKDLETVATFRGARENEHQGQEKIMMLGEAIQFFKDESSPCLIRVNPVRLDGGEGLGREYLCEDLVVAPVLDSITKKWLISDPSDAMALLAISPEDQKRYGIEFVFYMITNRGLPDDTEPRARVLRDKVEELAFMSSRVPIKKGSASFFVVIINLENSLEELAFIRNYKLSDDYARCLFVTSDFKIQTGNFEEIQYRGDNIDTVFEPMINWYQKSERMS